MTNSEMSVDRLLEKCGKCKGDESKIETNIVAIKSNDSLSNVVAGSLIWLSSSHAAQQFLEISQLTVCVSCETLTLFTTNCTTKCQ